MLKTMDSITTKVNQLKATAQELYTSMGIEEFAKNTLDFLTQIMERINSMGKLGKFPAQALATVISLISAIKNVAGASLKGIAKLIENRKLKFNTNIEQVRKDWDSLLQQRTVEIRMKLNEQDKAQVEAQIGAITGKPVGGNASVGTPIQSNSNSYKYVFDPKGSAVKLTEAEYAIIQNHKKGWMRSPEIQKLRERAGWQDQDYNKFLSSSLNTKNIVPLEEVEKATKENTNILSRGVNFLGQNKQTVGAILQTLGSIGTLIGFGMKTNSDSKVEGGKVTTGIGQFVTGIGSMLMGPMGWAMGAVSILTGVVSLVDGLVITADERLTILESELKEKEQESLKSRAEANDLDSLIEKYERLKEARYNSEEDYEAFIEFSNELGESHSELISYYDEEGNAILNINNAYSNLLKLRHQEYEDALEVAKKRQEINNAYLEELEETDIALDLEGNNLVSYGQDLLTRLEILADNYQEEKGTKISSDGLFSDMEFMNYVKEKSDNAAEGDIAYGVYDALIPLENGSYELPSSPFSFNKEFFLGESGIKAYENSKEFLSGMGINDENAALSILRTSFENMVNDFSEGLQEFLGLNNLDFNNLTLDEIYGHLQQISTIFEGIENSSLGFEIKLLEAQERLTSSTATAVASQHHIAPERLLEVSESSFAQALSYGGATEDEIFSFYAGKKTNLELERIEEVLNSGHQYSDMGSWMKAVEEAVGEENKYLDAYMSDYWEKVLSAEESFYENYFSGLDDAYKISGDINVPVGLMREVVDKWGEMVSSNFYNGLVVRADFYTDKLNELFKAAEGDYDLVSLITSSDLTSRSGIKLAKEKWIEAGGSEDALEIFDIMLSNLFLNANTAVETYVSELKGTAEKVKNAGELYSKGTTDLEEMANIRSLLSQEGFDEGQVFEWDETQEAFRFTAEAYQKWREIQEEQATQLREDAEVVLDNAETMSRALNEKKLESGSNEEEIDKVFTTLINEAIEDENHALADAYEVLQNQWKDFLTTNENATWGEFIKQWNGDLEYLAEELKLSAEEAEQLLNLYSPIRQASDITNLSEYFASKNILGWGVADAARVLKSKNLSLGEKQHSIKIIEDAQNTLFDILAAGQDATEAQIVEWSLALGQESTELVEGIINGELTLEKASLKLGFDIDTSTQVYVDAYNAWLGNTTDTLTDSAIALLEMEEGQMISQEFVGKLRSKYPEIADAILSSFSNGKFNGKYLGISNAFLQSGDLDLKNAGQQMVESYMGLISDGLSGSLSYEDASKLIKEFDLDIEADFTKGEKGLSISLGTAHKLYQELVAIDGKLASMAMDSMVEEVEEWYGGNLDVAKTLRLIEETRQKIADAEKKKDTTKKEQYEAELKVLNEIYARREAEDFAFMNRSLGDLENPITFWENSIQATDAMYTASTSGYMGVEEFVNIMSFTQDMMIQTGMDTQKAGIDCQALMLEGFRAMTSVDGELQIPMASLGADFVEGANGMYDNFQDGIQTIAKAQIEMLDAQIAMLEAVVAFEELDDNGNGRLGMGELFVETAEGYAYNEDTKRALEKLREKLGEDNKIYEQVIGEIEGELITFGDLFDPNKTWTEEQAKYIQEYLNKIMQFYDENGNFDQEGFLKWAADYNKYWIDFKKKIEGLVNEGDTVEIEINGKKINVTKTEGGYTITDDNTTEGPFSSAEEAVGSLYQKYIPEINPEDYASSSQPPVEMPMEVVISPKIELVYGTPTIEDPTAEDYPYLAEEMKRNPLIGKIYSNKETVIGTQEVPYDLNFNVNVVSENIPDALFTVLETGSGEYDITFKSSEENLALLAGLNDEIEEMSDLVTTPIELISLENLDMANLFIYELIENLKKLGTINPDTKIEPTKTTVSPTTGMTGELPTLADPSSMYDPEEIFNPIKLEFEETAGEINSDFNLQPSVDNAVKAETAINNFSTKLKGLSFASAIYNVSLFANALAKIPAKQTIDIVVNIQANSSTGEETDSTVSLTQARGTTQRITISTNGASGKGNVALSRGTLMGELGPELVVSNGRYFVVGQNGAEFVNLADDAIVFNHLQTRQLLNNGNTSHGRPVKNERTSVGMAAGNVDGPAKASAKETLAELYKLRAMWQAMLDWSTKDLASMAKPGGSGGGGGGDKSDNTSFIAELERWYNLLRQIAKWEEKITLEQAKRKNMLKGYDYTASLERELSYLKQQQAAHEELATKRREYYEALRKDLNSTVFAEIFTYDEDGLMQYKKGGFEYLSEILATNADGTPKHKAADQWGMLVDKFGEGRLASFKINDDGSPAENEEQFLENFFAREESWRETMDSAYDALYEEEKAIEETITAQTEIQQEYIDTQLSFEDKLYQALEDKLQAQIDALEDEKEALENASQSYINGLNEALNNEKNMFGKNQSKQETEQLQRRLAILERSGGSQSEINSLREQIDARLQDSYFEAAQEQIDAVQKAADAQIEKLDEQIDIMTDALEHQKENGLLWQEVYKMMAQWTPSQLVDFIEDYTQSMRENSPLQNQEDLKEALKEAEILDGKKRAEEAEKNWNEYSKTLNLDGMTSSEVEKVKQAYVGAAITGGTPGIAATDKLNSLKQQKKEEEDAIAAGRESVENTSDKYWKGVLMSPGYTQSVFKSKSHKDSNIISTIGTGNAVVTDYDPATGWLTLKYWKDQYGNPVKGKTGYIRRNSNWSKNNLMARYTSDFNKYLTKFKSGGLIDFTGPAWVDGTKSKPESILSAEDTALLRSRIFSDSEYSLRSAVEALRELRTNWRDVISNEYSGGVNIDNVEINFNSGTISSDYDMRRAADVAFEELRNLARKTTGVSLNRR